MKYETLTSDAVDRVADHVGGALLAFRALGHVDPASSYEARREACLR
jgi:hypothetical protein